MFFFFSILYLTLDNDVSVTYFEEDTYYLENYRIYNSYFYLLHKRKHEENSYLMVLFQW